jgi:branched-chain amino acid aminotransferase
MPAWSQTLTFLDGEWLEGNHPIVGARTHAFWLGSSVFDGARAFQISTSIVRVSIARPKPCASSRR